MTGIWQASTAVLWVLTWLSSPPASLADAAAKEAIRRQTSPKATATLTNMGRPVEPPPPPAVSLPAPPEPPPSNQVMPPPPPNAPPAAQEPAKDEAWWRARITNAKQRLSKLDFMTEAIQSRINALERDAVNIDDPLQQNKARQDLGRALGELDNTKKQIADTQKEIAAIHDEARRLNVPPGWIR